MQWYYGHHERAKASNRRWYQLNKTKKNSRRNQLMKAARARDPGIRVRYNLRVRLSNLIRQSGLKKFSVNHHLYVWADHQTDVAVSLAGQFNNAHEESKKKAERSAHNYAVLVEKAKKGIPVWPAARMGCNPGG